MESNAYSWVSDVTEYPVTEDSSCWAGSKLSARDESWPAVQYSPALELGALYGQVCSALLSEYRLRSTVLHGRVIVAQGSAAPRCPLTVQIPLTKDKDENDANTVCKEGGGVVTAILIRIRPSIAINPRFTFSGYTYVARRTCLVFTGSSRLHRLQSVVDGGSSEASSLESTEQSSTSQPLPKIYAAFVVLWRVYTFNDCEDAAKELQQVTA
ncbi:hypothetical protein J6590_001519 [Homalodisca vitripennis]|nr:hypothetical protein J6590_001519 [Homalodisca vitripennis]